MPPRVPPPDAAPPSASRRAVSTIAVLCVVAIALGMLVLAEARDLRPTEARGAAVTTTTSLAARKSTKTTKPRPSTSTATNNAPATAPPGTMPTTSPITVTLTLSPKTVHGEAFDITAPDAPTLTWSSTNAASVFVYGPGVSEFVSEGSVVACPGYVDGTTCVVMPGTYTYRLDASGFSGAPASRLVTLTVTA